jgi:hypothetical protein
MANVTDLLEAVKAKSAARTADLNRDWWAAVKAVATGGKVSPDKVASLLEQLGRTPDDFAKAVHQHADRLALRASIAEADELDRKAAVAREKLAALSAELERAEEKFDTAARPLRAEVEYAADKRLAAAEARKRLFNDCPYPHLRERLAGIGRDIAAADARIKGASELVGRYSFIRTESADYIRRQYSAEEVETAKQRLPQVEAERAAARAEKDRLTAELSKAEEEFLIP